MKIHSILHGSRANGPGSRTVIWVQGCSIKFAPGIIHCPGCWNQKLWPADGRATDWQPEVLAEHIVESSPRGTEGITISGGEPAQQAHQLALFLASIKKLRPYLSVGMFTGYDLVELNSGQYQCEYSERGEKIELWRLIGRHLDFIITGRYDRTKPIPADVDYKQTPWLKLCGSTNQRLDIWKRYQYSHFDEHLLAEYAIDEQGLVTLTGFPL